jgi:hypothetical protein
LGLLVVTAGLALLSRAPNFAFALSSRVVWIIGYRVAFVSVMTAVAVVVPPERRSTAMGILGAMSSLASVVGARPIERFQRAATDWRKGRTRALSPIHSFGRWSCSGLRTSEDSAQRFSSRRPLPPRWWELSRHRWSELYEPHRLDLMVAQMHVLIRKLEEVGRRKFRPQALIEWMEGVNRREEYFDEVRDLICSAAQTPVRMNEQVINVMNAQWHRGSEWAIGHARAFRDEVRSRVEQGIAAYPREKLRLMWVGAGLWHDTEFYTAFEESHGAVFVWSMYLAFGPDGYIRYGLDDPLRALASRIVSMNEQLHNPPWANEWIVEQARRHRIDAALILVPEGSRPSATGSYFIKSALENAGIPTLEIWADMVDSRRWDAPAMRKRMAEFIDIRVQRGTYNTPKNKKPGSP